MTDTEEDCQNELVRHSQNSIGLNSTFFYVNILFFVIGMGFGTSYSITYVDPYDWVRTAFYKRLIRGVAGVALVFGLNTLLGIVTVVD